MWINKDVLMLLAISSVLVACQPQTFTKAPADGDDELTLGLAEVAEELERYVREQQGFLNCEQYLTDIESDDYCSSDRPQDWKAFEYDGETYYFQPLARARN